MKTVSLLILIAIVISIMSTLCIATPLSSASGKTLIRTLDVCSKSAHTLNSELSSICEDRFILMPLEFSESYKMPGPSAYSFLIISREEQPPRS